MVGRWLALAGPVAAGLAFAVSPETVLGPLPPSGDEGRKFWALAFEFVVVLGALAFVGVFAGVWWRQARMVAHDERQHGSGAGRPAS